MHFHSNSLEAELSPFNLSHTMFNINKEEQRSSQKERYIAAQLSVNQLKIKKEIKQNSESITSAFQLNLSSIILGLFHL